ncbi:hypothetical protein HWN39_10615 [Lactobacillus rhamnosus]|uniref:Transcriptional regulator n=1 Tax=Lacticaseibacillus rhamnosus TaxID=47715 RepID=A0A7Y7UJX6_LACRH|nr:hypothetical protein [Lacticaseibacillus rhamnosus]NVO88930.1 hypothetical protein [Lacticaseibacillus rhamnosus]
MEELSKDDLKTLDNEFQKYQHINHDTAVAILEIDNPWQPSDENIGGGRSTKISRPQQQMMEAREHSKRLQYLWELKADCERAIKRMDNEQLQIYHLRYQSTNYYDWDTVGDLMGYAHSAIYRKRYAMLHLLAEERGMVSKDGTKIAISPKKKEE